MTCFRWKVYAGGTLLVLLLALAARAAWADANPAVLPDPGSTRSFSASEQFESPGGFMPPGNAPTMKGVTRPHSQSGTLTLNRVSNDSLHLTASDGLDAFDQTLHVDGRGIVDQSKPPYAFTDLLNSLSAMMAAAPAALQKDATWTTSIATPSWLSNVRGSMPKEMSEVTMTMKVAAVAGNTMLVHGDGKNEFKMATGMGAERSVIAMAIDCAFVSGQMRKCSRKTTMEMSVGAMDMTFGDNVELATK
jgi:hypothetical protein